MEAIMEDKFANLAQRSSEISEKERNAATQAIKEFAVFLRTLWAARQHDQRLVNVLERNPDTDPSTLFEQRHLLRKFQQEVKDRYTKIIFHFAGKRDENNNSITAGILHILKPLEKDTKTRQIKSALQDAMQQFTEFMEEFLEAFEDFNNKEQIHKIVNSSKKADQLAQSIENIIDKQLLPHFKKNVLQQERVGTIKHKIQRRARLIKMLEAQ